MDVIEDDCDDNVNDFYSITAVEKKIGTFDHTIVKWLNVENINKVWTETLENAISETEAKKKQIVEKKVKFQKTCSTLSFDITPETISHPLRNMTVVTTKIDLKEDRGKGKIYQKFDSDSRLVSEVVNSLLVEYTGTKSLRKLNFKNIPTMDFIKLDEKYKAWMYQKKYLVLDSKTVDIHRARENFTELFQVPYMEAIMARAGHKHISPEEKIIREFKDPFLGIYQENFYYACFCKKKKKKKCECDNTPGSFAKTYIHYPPVIDFFTQMTQKEIDILENPTAWINDTLINYFVE
eukprot:Awhi_evm1s4993